MLRTGLEESDAKFEVEAASDTRPAGVATGRRRRCCLHCFWGISLSIFPSLHLSASLCLAGCSESDLILCVVPKKRSQLSKL